MPTLPIAARLVHIVPDMTELLISIGQLCSAGFEIEFTATSITVYHDNKTVLTGMQTSSSQLWHFHEPKTKKANAAISTTTHADLVNFAHAALFSPTISTLENALQQGLLTNIPGLTLAMPKKNPPDSC